MAFLLHEERLRLKDQVLDETLKEDRYAPCPQGCRFKGSPSVAKWVPGEAGSGKEEDFEAENEGDGHDHQIEAMLQKADDATDTLVGTFYTDTCSYLDYQFVRLLLDYPYMSFCRVCEIVCEIVSMFFK